MAHAKIETVSHVVLTLTMEEAVTLIDIMRRIGGDMIKSRRYHTDAIANTLEMAGVKHTENARDIDDDYGRILFTPHNYPSNPLRKEYRS